MGSADAAPGAAESGRWPWQPHLRWALALLALMVLAVAALYLYAQRRAGEREAIGRSELFARVVEEQTSRTIGIAAATLHSVADHPAVREPERDPAAVSKLLEQHLPGQPHLRSLSLLDATGTIIASTTATDMGRQLAPERLGIRESLQGRLVLGPVLAVRDLGELSQGRSAPQAVAALPLLLRREVNSTVHWLVALMNVDYFATQHSLIVGNQDIRVLTLRLNGDLVVATGDLEIAAGTDLKRLPPFERFLPAQERAAYIGAGSAGRPAVAAFRTSRQWPLVVIAEQSQDRLAVAWRQDAGWVAAASLAIVALLAGLGLVLEQGLRRDARSQARLTALNDELARTEERWKLALEGAGHGVWDMDLTSGTMTVSPHLLATLGYTGGSLVWPARAWRETLHPADVAAVMAAAVRHITGRSAHLAVELRIRAADGDWRWMTFRGALIRQSNAAAGGRLLGTATDISRRKSAELALSRSEVRLQAILDSAFDGIIAVDASQQVVLFNPAASRIFGWPASEAVGQHSKAFIPERYRASYVSTLLSLVAPEQAASAPSRSALFTGLRRNGEEFPLETSLSRVVLDGRDYYTAIVRDVTEQQRVLAALQRSEERFRAAFDQAAVGILEQAPDRRFLRANRALCQLLGYSEEEFLALPADKLIHPDDIASGQAAMKQLFEGSIGSFTQEKRYRHRAGHHVWVRLTASIARTAYGGLGHMVAIIEDISASRQAQAELERARERELDTGTRIQRSLLVVPPDQRLPGLWLSTLNQASQGVDGDFVEVVSLGGPTVDIIIGDVMGKGVAAALMGAATKMQFARCITELLARPGRGDRLPEPAAIVKEVHRSMAAQLEALEAFVALSYVRLDMKSGTATWVGCGHEEPLLLRGGRKLSTLPNQHPPIGVLAHCIYEQDEVQFGPSDTLLLASDGVSDALLPDGSRLGRRQVVALLQELLAELATPAAVLHALRREIGTLGAVITDDLTMALAMGSADARRELAADLADLVHVRGLVEHRAAQAGLDPVDAGLFALACVEAFTNLVRHTRGRPAGAPVEVVARTRAAVVEIDIVSLGDPFEPLPPPPEIDLSTYPEGGLGRTVMALTTDEVSYRHRCGVNTVTLRRKARVARCKPLHPTCSAA